MKNLTLYFVLFTFYCLMTVTGQNQSASNWGGEHVGLEMTAQGGRLEFDCAHGELDEKLVPDARGRFKVPGSYVLERGGPVREPGHGEGVKVYYSGRINDDVMKLTIRRRDNNRLIGSFTLVKGREPEIVKCK